MKKDDRKRRMSMENDTYRVKKDDQRRRMRMEKDTHGVKEEKEENEGKEEKEEGRSRTRGWSGGTRGEKRTKFEKMTRE